MVDKIKGKCFFDMGGPPLKLDTEIVTFLCPYCPNVHFEIYIVGVGVIRYVWFTEHAENLAKMLNDPGPMPPEDLHVFTEQK